MLRMFLWMPPGPMRVYALPWMIPEQLFSWAEQHFLVTEVQTCPCYLSESASTQIESV